MTSNYSQVLIHFKGFAKKFDRWIRREDAAKHIRPFGRAKFHLKKLHDARMRHMLSSNIKWSVRGMGDHRVAPGVPSHSSSSSTAAVTTESKNGGFFDGYKGEYAGDGGRAVPYTSGKGGVNPRIRCIDDEERERKIADMSDKYVHYVNALQEKDLDVIKVSGDGNCLFRAVAHQIYGDESYHHIVRQKCMDYMESEAEFFSQFVVGGREFFHVYIDAKRKDACWGDDPEIEAICELYDRPAEIWAYDPTTGARKLRTFHESAGGLDSFLRIGEVEDWSREEDEDMGRAVVDSTRASSQNNMTNHGNGLVGMEVVDMHANQGSQSNSNGSYSSDQRNHSPVSTIQEQIDTQDDDVDPADDAPAINRHTISARGNSGNQNASSARPNSRGSASTTRCPVMRLSYYGGGHYDSIVGFDHRSNLLRSKPGDREDQRIRHSRAMAAESARLANLAPSGVSSSSSTSRPSSSSGATVASGSGFAVTSQRHRIQREEEEAKRREEEAVLALSRRTAEEKEQEDLETSLFLSMQSQTIQPYDEEGAVLKLVAAESEREYLEHELHSSLLAEAHGAIGQTNSDSGAERMVDDDEAALLALAIAQSKEDISYRALESSSSPSAVAISPTGDDIDLAMKLSTLSEEEAYNLAIQQSLSRGSQQVAESKSSYQSVERGSVRPASSPSRNVSNQNGYSQNSFMEDEDALLQQALAESLQGQTSYAAYNHHNPGQGNRNQNQQPEAISMDMYGMMDEGEYDEELMRAIQESLRR